MIACGVGALSANQFLGAYCNVSSTPSWLGAVFGGVTVAGAAPRASGDVVIVSYTHATGTLNLWVNGVKTSVGGGALALPSVKKYGIGGFGGTRFGQMDVGFFQCANATIDDTAAAAWTTWLQDRYGIPEL
jgi:hypothetical protein